MEWLVIALEINKPEWIDLEIVIACGRISTEYNYFTRLNI